MVVVLHEKENSSVNIPVWIIIDNILDQVFQTTSGADIPYCKAVCVYAFCLRVKLLYYLFCWICLLYNKFVYSMYMKAVRSRRQYELMLRLWTPDKQSNKCSSRASTWTVQCVNQNMFNRTKTHTNINLLPIMVVSAIENEYNVYTCMNHNKTPLYGYMFWIFYRTK